MFRKRRSIKDNPHDTVPAAITINALRQITANMEDAEIIERQLPNSVMVTPIYIRTLIDQERLNESIIEPLTRCVYDTVQNSIFSWKSPLWMRQKSICSQGAL
ncbi:hypothetical protein [Peribacillus cavernae]|uniref:hypothetical protein n=1 Tax=Peribacillus cavernae TaxID=1674310 RepID=UPI001FE6F544|nr:hypothetical protein [Peribacillus cavernae]MDQ0220618.1 hypothetical protein [Peribacillus cavernae]